MEEGDREGDREEVWSKTNLPCQEKLEERKRDEFRVKVGKNPER